MKIIAFTTIQLLAFTIQLYVALNILKFAFITLILIKKSSTLKPRISTAIPFEKFSKGFQSYRTFITFVVKRWKSLKICIKISLFIYNKKLKIIL